jgi:hypothetical protein
MLEHSNSEDAERDQKAPDGVVMLTFDRSTVRVIDGADEWLRSFVARHCGIGCLWY